MLNREKVLVAGKNGNVELEIGAGICNFTADAPEIKVTPTGKKVIGEFGFSVAFSKGKNVPSVFMQVEAWDRQAELIKSYVKKGDRAYVYGRIKKDTYTNKEGVEVTNEIFVIQNFRLLNGPKNAENAEIEALEVPEDFIPAEGLEEEIPF